MFWDQQVQYAAMSDIGFRRQNNQDSYSVRVRSEIADWENRGHLFIVADGMGGHAVGELASKMAVDIVPHAYEKTRDVEPREALRAAIETANGNIYDRGVQNPDFLRMGTTCSSLLLGPFGAILGHVGDSRVYRVQDQRIDQLTADHSLVWELIRQRKVHPDEAARLYPRNVITRSLGPEPKVVVDIEGPLPVFPGDAFVVCSDGLTCMLSDSEIGMITSELSPGEACRLMVNLSNLRGGPDNITVIVVKVGASRSNATPRTPSIPAGEHPYWTRIVGLSGIFLPFLAGLACLTMLQFVAASVLIGFGVIFGIVWWLTMKPMAPAPSPSGESTITWRPYRTASAHVDHAGIDRLARIINELQRAAHEEHWPINWGAHESLKTTWMSALNARNYSDALRAAAKDMDILMEGLHWQRRQIVGEMKTKPTNPTPRP